MYDFEYDEAKNILLKEARGINFEDVIEAIKHKQILDDVNHFNPSRYPNQRILVVNIHQYAYAVPYVIDHKRQKIFLKTIYPNRKLTKKYL